MYGTKLLMVSGLPSIDKVGFGDFEHALKTCSVVLRNRSREWKLLF